MRMFIAGGCHWHASFIFEDFPMSIKSSVRILSCCALASATGMAAPLSYAAPILVCGFPESPTKMIDLAVSSAIFRDLHKPYRLVDLNHEIGGQSTSEYTIAKLLKSKCDVFMGVPISTEDFQFKGGMAVSTAYMRADFVKFTAPSAVLKKSGAGVVAVAYKSPAQLIAAEEKDADFDVENNTADVIQSVLRGHAQFGITWYPSLVEYQREHPAAHFAAQPTQTKISDWTLSFVADDKNRTLIQQISASIRHLSASGKMASLTQPWSMHATSAQSVGDAIAKFVPAVDALSTADGAERSLSGRVVDAADTSSTPHEANFAASQVIPGKKLYAAECAQCHGDALQGRTAPALRGPGFAPTSNSTMTVGGIYQYMTTNMPADKPGKLKPKDYAKIMAFLLHENGYRPSGQNLSPSTAGDDPSPFNSFVK